MIIDCSQTNLRDGLALASSAITSRTTVKLFESLMLDASETDKLRIVGTDGDLWVENTIPASIRQPSTFAAPAALLRDMVNSLAPGELRIELASETSLHISQGNSQYRVVGQRPDDFADVPMIASDTPISLPETELEKLLESVLFATAPDSPRAAFTGVLFDYDGETLKLVATDSHRLALREASFPGAGSAVNALVSARALGIIKKLPVGEDGLVTLMFGEDRCSAATDDARVVSALIKDAFPPYARVIPQETSRSWMMDKPTLLEALKRCAIMAKAGSQRVTLQSDGDIATLTSKSEGIGDAREEVPIVKEGDDITISFNVDYLLAAAQAVDSEGVKLEMTEENRAAVVRPTEGDGYLCVIMPMSNL
jgi:DNA polymerase-3 subunit beta